MNGAGSARISPSALTVVSLIASSIADWVRGEVRLISSQRRCWRRSVGPELEGLVVLAVDRDPGHVGGRIRVHWMRLKEQSMERAIAFASTVLPTGNVLDEGVSTCEQTGDHAIATRVLPM